MAAHLEANPAARAVVNFTPVLIEQLEELGRRIGAHLRSGSALPDPVLALLGPEPVPTDPAAAPRAAARLPARAAQADDRALRALPRARHHRRDARRRPSASSTPPTSSSTIWRSGTTSPGSARRCAACDPLVARLTERGRDFTAAHRRELLTLIGELVSHVVPRYRAPRRARPLRALGHPLRPPDHPAAARLSVRARRGAPHAAARARRLSGRRGARHLARRGGHPRVHARLRRRARRLLAVGRGHQRARRWSCSTAGGFRWAASSANVLRSSLALADATGGRGPAGLQPPVPPRRHRHELLLPRRRAVRPHRLHLRDLARR